MRFSYKVFIVTILVVVLSFSIGGYFLVSSMFTSTLNSEIAAALHENRMLRYSYEAILSVAPEHTQEVFVKTSDNILSGSDNIADVRIYEDSAKVVYESTKVSVGAGLLEMTDEKTRGYQIQNDGERYYLHTVCVMKPGAESLYYLESIREITGIFSLREEQLAVFQRIMIIVTLISGLITLVLASLLTRPIRKLAGMTRSIAGGNLAKRVSAGGRDEIGQLARDFNHMADEVEERILELENMNRKQEDFIASFAHELKTPLTSIIGYADMLRSKRLSPEDQFLSADYIFQEGRRLEKLSLKLLDLIVLGKQDFEKKVVPVGYLFDSVKAFMLPAIHKKNIHMEVLTEDASLLVEPDLFKTLLLNLLDNARKAVAEGGLIKVIGRREGKGYVIFICDNGKGMDKKELSRITEPFYMVDKSRARREGGSGLGLAICTEIVRLHDGTIEFQSAPGRGTVIRLEFQEARYG